MKTRSLHSKGSQIRLTTACTVVLIAGLLLAGCVTPEMTARQNARLKAQRQAAASMGTLSIGGSSQFAGRKVFVDGSLVGTLPEGDIGIAYKVLKRKLQPGPHVVEIGYGVGRAEGYAKDDYTITHRYNIRIVAGQEKSIYVK